MENPPVSSQTNVNSGVSAFWKVLIAVVASAVIAGVGTYYLVSIQANAQKDDLNSQITTLQKQVDDLKKADSADSTAAVDEKTKDWATYNNDVYNLSFKYPINFGNPDTTVYTKGQSDTNMPSDNRITFPDKTDLTITLYKISDFSEAIWTTAANRLKFIYQNKTVDSNNLPEFPIFSAKISAKNSPRYIESTDGSYRGIYFYANIGNGMSATLNAEAYMTNGTNIVKMSVSRDSDKKGNYPAPEKWNDYLTYVGSLTDVSDEMVVKEFNNIYKYIVLSLKNL